MKKSLILAGLAAVVVVGSATGFSYHTMVKDASIVAAPTEMSTPTDTPIPIPTDAPTPTIKMWPTFTPVPYKISVESPKSNSTANPTPETKTNESNIIVCDESKGNCPNNPPVTITVDSCKENCGETHITVETSH